MSACLLYRGSYMSTCVLYSKTCLKQPLKNRQNIDINDRW